MKAIVYKDELGKEQDDDRDPRASSPKPATAAREHLLEEVSHYDDALLELILEEARGPRGRLKHAIRKATLSTKLTPVLCGSSLQEQGRAAAARRGHRLPALAARRAAGRRAPS